MLRSELLDKAADILEPDCWIKEESFTVEQTELDPPVFVHKFCSTGVIKFGGMQADEDEKDHLIEVLANGILKTNPAYGSCESPEEIVVTWNDADERTLPEVLDLFRGCAKEEMKKEQGIS